VQFRLFKGMTLSSILTLMKDRILAKSSSDTLKNFVKVSKLRLIIVLTERALATLIRCFIKKENYVT